MFLISNCSHVIFNFNFVLDIKKTLCTEYDLSHSYWSKRTKSNNVIGYLGTVPKFWPIKSLEGGAYGRVAEGEGGAESSAVCCCCGPTELQRSEAALRYLGFGVYFSQNTPQRNNRWVLWFDWLKLRRMWSCFLTNLGWTVGSCPINEMKEALTC